jgi:asparagine synthase (glutamine-hydrolysing)
LVHLPASYKYKRGWSKYILRNTGTELPEEIRWRRDKKGFTVPEDAWCRTTLREDIQSIEKNSILAELGILDPKKFENYFEEFMKGNTRANSKEIFSVYVAEKWLRKIYTLESIK